ncbi:MAG: protease SohB, partial [Gammaproteobacteria bacterium]|nr:protease SohB [Gammaproteobacteria bacterium]
MTEFFIDFGLFFLKSVTVVAAIVAVIFAIVATSRGEGKLHGLNIEKLNDKYRKMAETLRHKMLSKSDWRKFEKQEKKDRKQEEKEAGDESRKRVFVLKFKGDMRASEVDSLREEVTAVTAVATNDDEIVVCLENSGGTVHEHGLGASQL